MTHKKQVPTIISKFRKNANQFLSQTIQSSNVDYSARKEGFVKRSTSRILGTEFLRALVETSLHSKPVPVSGIVDIMESINPRSSMTIQALRMRMNNCRAEAFMKSQLEEVVAKSNNYPKEPNEGSGKGILSSFSQVLLEDCSEWKIHHSLKEHYKGTGGPIENLSAMKLHTIWNYSNKKIIELKDTDRRTTDQQLANSIIKHIKPNTLVIRDLGFFTHQSLESIQNSKAFFLSRLRSRTNVYLDASATEPLNLADELEKSVKNGTPFDKEVYIFKGKFLVRLVAYKAKGAEARRREKDYLKRCRKGKRVPNPNTLRLLKYNIYVTNVPKSVWPTEVVEIAYRVRWQIELLFKCWKSQINIHIFEGTNIHRIRCLLYAKLIGLIIIQECHSKLQNYAENNLSKEVSLTKLINWLQREGRITQIIRYGYTEGIWKKMFNQLDRLLTKENNRSRQTTKQLTEKARATA